MMGMMGMVGPGMMNPDMMGMMGPGMMGPGMTNRDAMSGYNARMASMVEGRLAYLKSALGITEAQSEPWSGYAAAVTGQAQAMQSMHQGMMDNMLKGGAIERMDARITGMAAMVEAMRSVKPPMETLYGVLNEEQKKIADQLIGMDCGAM